MSRERTYRHYKRPVLAKFARDRKLRVLSTGKTPSNPLKKDLVQALEAADAQRTFELFRLPPELRNIVYKELLVLNYSFTCHPQILCASKTVKAEASNILYGDNLIEIKVFRDGVYVHGKKCGNYEFDLAHGSTSLVKREGHIDWPDFLRRVQFIRMSVESNQEPANQRRTWIPCIGSLHFIVHSACYFLIKGHKLRFFELDLSQLRDLFARNGAYRDFEAQVSIALCPLRLLSRIKTLRIEGTSADLSFVYKTPTDISEDARQFMTSTTPTVIGKIYSTRLTELSLVASGQTLLLMKGFAVAGTWLVMRIARINTPAMLRSAWKDVAVKYLRRGWDQERPGRRLSAECIKEIGAIVRLEIEVELLLQQRERSRAENEGLINSLVHGLGWRHCSNRRRKHHGDQTRLPES